jgi:hypothetical protein
MRPAIFLLVALAWTRPRAEEPSMSKTVSEAWIREAVAKSADVPADNLEVKLLEHADVPGVTVFRCRIISKHGHRGGFLVGVAQKGRVELDDDKTVNLVIAAWGYGKKRTVTPVAVARVIGFLEGTTEPAYPVLEQADVEALPNAAWKPHVYLPREAVVDGLPAVEYWNRDGRPPLWRAQLIIKEDGTAELRRQSIGSFVK